LRPGGQGIGNGIPTSPTVLRRVSSVLTHTSDRPTGDLSNTNAVNSKGGALQPLQRTFYAPMRIVK
jgi:hypothetical protein